MGITNFHLTYLILYITIQFNQSIMKKKIFNFTAHLVNARDTPVYLGMQFENYWNIG